MKYAILKNELRGVRQTMANGIGGRYVEALLEGSSVVKDKAQRGPKERDTSQEFPFSQKLEVCSIKGCETATFYLYYGNPVCARHKPQDKG